MSEAVVDDIVAVLPPLLQSLEALSFVARHLHPPDFDRVMQAAGTPDQALRRCASGSPTGPRNFPVSEARLKPPATRRSPHSAGCAWCTTAMAISSRCSSALRHATRAQEALYPLVAKLPPVSQFFVEPTLREDTALRSGCGAGQRKHRHHPQQQRARQPRRLFALCAGILHAGSPVAAGDGAAWRQRQRPRLSVELAA